MSLLSVRPVMPTSFSDNAIDRLLDEAVRAAGTHQPIWKPACNIYEDEHGMTVQLSVPGIDLNQLEVQVRENTLFIKGERALDESEGRRWYSRGIPEGPFSYGVQLPPTIDQQQSTASYKNGILSIAFPKREEAKPRRIDVACE